MTKKPKRVMTKTSKAGCRSADDRRKLAEDVLAHLNRSWELHGREILARVRAERPLFQGAGQVDTGSAPCDWRTDRLRPEAQSRGSIATPRSANS